MICLKKLEKPLKTNVFSGFSGTPDTIRTCDLQSRSFMTRSEEMQSYQGFAGFIPVLLENTELSGTVGNTGFAGIFRFWKNSSQMVVSSGFRFHFASAVLTSSKALAVQPSNRSC